MKLFGRVILAVVLPIAVGCLFILPTITSDNGYVAGFVFLPFFILAILLSVGLLLGGLIATGIKGRPGLWWLPAGPLLIVGFLGLAFIAKEFGWGAYREQPMIPFPPPIANRVDFKQNATHEDVEGFWTHVIGYQTDGDGAYFRPGVQSAVRSGERTVTFAFRADATDEQKADIRVRISAYSAVERYVENVPSEFADPPERDVISSKAGLKKTVTQNSNQ